MPCAFNPCPLEINTNCRLNSNNGLKREHLEFSFSATKNIIFFISITTMPMVTKLFRVMTYYEGLPPIKSNDPLPCGLARLRDKLNSL